jgi:Protein of unknown function (DUF4058)
MALHDWTNSAGWDGVHSLWIVELLRWIKPRLPEGYRAYIGSTPALTVGTGDERADVVVRQWLPEPPADTHPSLPEAAGNAPEFPEPDVELATLTLVPQKALFITVHGRMIAAVELISPRNNDRPSSRANYVSRYLGYMLDGAHLLLVDVHRRPINFSFAEALAQELQIRQPPSPAPVAVSYRVGEPAATGGRYIAPWRRELVVGQPLPTMPLPLTLHVNIPVDLEFTYSRAAADAYLT